LLYATRHPKSSWTVFQSINIASQSSQNHGGKQAHQAQQTRKKRAKGGSVKAPETLAASDNLGLAARMSE
jgi:hypothetical protein